MWDNVLKGERLYIQPYRPSADIHINTVHKFEPFLYRKKIEAALADYPADALHQGTVQNLIERYLQFSSCSGEYLSQDSLIREFYQDSK